MLKIAGWVVSAEPRLYVLEELSSEGSTPAEEISEDRELQMRYVSRACSELSEKGLVECSRSDDCGDGSCEITERGEHTLTLIEEHSENLAVGDEASIQSPAV